MTAASVHNNLNAKLVLLGDMGAGKSSLVIRFVKGQFLEFQESTIGAAFFSSTVSVNNSTVKFEIWDTAGQERYHSLMPMYYRGAAAAIIVYDIISTDLFARAKKWVQELQKQGNPNMVMAFAGNKADLEDKRKVTAERKTAYFSWRPLPKLLLMSMIYFTKSLNDCLELNLLKIRQERYVLTEQQKDHELHHAAVKYYHLDPSIDFVTFLALHVVLVWT